MRAAPKVFLEAHCRRRSETPSGVMCSATGVLPVAEAGAKAKRENTCAAGLRPSGRQYLQEEYPLMCSRSSTTVIEFSGFPDDAKSGCRDVLMRAIASLRVRTPRTRCECCQGRLTMCWLDQGLTRLQIRYATREPLRLIDTHKAYTDFCGTRSNVWARRPAPLKHAKRLCAGNANKNGIARLAQLREQGAPFGGRAVAHKRAREGTRLAMGSASSSMCACDEGSRLARSGESTSTLPPAAINASMVAM